MPAPCNDPALVKAPIARVKAALGETPSPNRYTDISCLKHTADSAVFTCRDGGIKLIIKHFYSERRAIIVRRLKDELAYLATHMRDPAYRVNKCLDVHPAQGLAMLEYIPGDTLATRLLNAPQAERIRIMASCSHWLERYIGPRQQRKPFPSKKWVHHLGETALPAMRDEKRYILDVLLARLVAQASQLEGQSALFAASHGDFSSKNLIQNGNTICGVDIQGKTVVPVLQELARFLVWQHTEYPQPDQPLKNGVFTTDKHALFQHFPMLQGGEQNVFTFFLGYQIFLRLLTMRSAPDVFDRAATLMTSYLADIDEE